MQAPKKGSTQNFVSRIKVQNVSKFQVPTMAVYILFIHFSSYQSLVKVGKYE